MKLQTLAVLFILIMLPITVVTSRYIKTEISTINTEAYYDLKLTNATYDALKAFQLNESNSTTDNITTEKIRDVNASIKTFYNSLASSMGVAGYTEDDLKYYIPCLVYNLYDGYYIYTKSSTGEYELKPYIYYTEHLTNGSKNCTISYTLDNYIMVVLKDGDDIITKSGYLYVENYDLGNDPEFLSEYIDDNNQYSYVYRNFNGQSVKYYRESYLDWYKMNKTGDLIKEKDPTYIESLNESARTGRITDYSFKTYIEESKKFTDWIHNEKLYEYKRNENGREIAADYLKIDINNDPDNYSSKFNNHRRDVIKKSIESGLEATILNYKGGAAVDYQMPELDETEWDKIINNVSLISFMQGFPLKNKLYRGYCVVTNTKSREFVDPDEIYLIIQDEKYHKITWKGYTEEDVIAGAYRNIDFEKRVTKSGGEFLPQKALACYESIVSAYNVYRGSTFKSATQTALDAPDMKENVKKAYYKALYRERYANYKSLNFGS